MLPTDILCSSYPAWPPGPVLKTNLFTYPNVFSNILEFSLKARWCFSRLPGLWFCPLETGMMLVLVPPQQTQHNSLQGDSPLKKGRSKSDYWDFFCLSVPRFYSRVFQGVAESQSRIKMVSTGRCCPCVCEGTKPTGNTRPELGCENTGIGPGLFSAQLSQLLKQDF